MEGGRCEQTCVSCVALFCVRIADALFGIVDFFWLAMRAGLAVVLAAALLPLTLSVQDKDDDSLGQTAVHDGQLRVQYCMG